MNPDGQLKRVAMVQFERILPGPIERVWAFVTDPRKLPAGLARAPSSRARAVP